ncbi:uncharacterized protein NECHADRAFT_84074 [Fusarium vanettenii 77-13-4]|uniref:Secreted protein n=1 Tax=Fusarium vanettenii (strain ATCC MYA-4622 / CBS 123669 / FGSC 9596 / NRRL 45880 / 77-13-4) TaxID=660122 RepID=C7YZL9_FUSV7|nr:uncharacterized protein NECHADRAFT_84074 [Fusarium vanettenii 77-13-4]EEU42628.1 predicted protein [Fusarium vanettenii 77-13-4]
MSLVTVLVVAAWHTLASGAPLLVGTPQRSLTRDDDDVPVNLWRPSCLQSRLELGGSRGFQPNLPLFGDLAVGERALRSSTDLRVDGWSPKALAWARKFPVVPSCVLSSGPHRRQCDVHGTGSRATFSSREGQEGLARTEGRRETKDPKEPPQGKATLHRVYRSYPGCRWRDIELCRENSGQ